MDKDMGEVSGNRKGPVVEGTVSDTAGEAALFARMRTLDREAKLSYAEVGRICLIVRENRLHLHRLNPNTGEQCTWTEWVSLAAPWGYSTCFEAVRDVEALPDIPKEELAQIPKGNIKTLVKMSTGVRSQGAVLEAAKTQRPEAFIEHVKRHHGDQHIEQTQILRFSVNESEALVVEEVLAAEIKKDGTLSRSGALVSVFTEHWVRANAEGLKK
jgi:hypothetical protein